MIVKYPICRELRRELHRSGHWQHWFSVKLESDLVSVEVERQAAHVKPEHAVVILSTLDRALYHLICDERKRPFFQHAIEYFRHHPNPRYELLKIIWALLVLFLLAGHAHAQGGVDVAWQFNLTNGAGDRSAFFDNRARGCTTLHLVYFNSGFAALGGGVELDWAADNNGVAGPWNTWTDLQAGSTFPLTDAISSQISAYKFKPWVSVKLISATGSGHVYGYVICRNAGANQNAAFAGDILSANQGTPAAIGNAWPVKVTDGVTAVSLTGTSLNVNCTAGCGGGGSVDVSDRAGRLLGIVASIASAVDVSDRAGRAVGAVSGTGTFTTDPTDRAGRLLGHVTVDSAPTTAVTGPLTDAQLRASAVPISAASLPLPAGAATDASLTTIDTDIKSSQPRKIQDSNGATIAVGQKAMAASVPVTMASDQTPVVMSSMMPAGQTGVAPVVIQSAPPALSQRVSANPLLYRDAMKSYCYQNLNGCGPGR